MKTPFLSMRGLVVFVIAFLFLLVSFFNIPHATNAQTSSQQTSVSECDEYWGSDGEATNETNERQGDLCRSCVTANDGEGNAQWYTRGGIRWSCVTAPQQVETSASCPTETTLQQFCQACIESGGSYVKYPQLETPNCMGVSYAEQQDLYDQAGLTTRQGSLELGLFGDRSKDILGITCGRPEEEGASSGLTSLSEASKCCAADLDFTTYEDNVINMTEGINAACLSDLTNGPLKIFASVASISIAPVLSVFGIGGGDGGEKACLSDLFVALPTKLTLKILPINQLVNESPEQTSCIEGADIAGDADRNSPSCRCVNADNENATAQIHGRRLAAYLKTQPSSVVLGAIPPTKDSTKCNALYKGDEVGMQQCLSCTQSGKWYSKELRCTTNAPDFVKVMGTFSQGSAHLCNRYVKGAENAACIDCAANSGIYTGMGCINTGLGGFARSAISTGISVGGGLAFLCILYAAFILQTSKGNPERLKKAREYLNSCIIGLLIIIFSVLILQVVGYDILRIPGFDTTIKFKGFTG